MLEPLPLKRPATPEDLAGLVRAAGEGNTQIKVTGSDTLPLTRFEPDRGVQGVSTLRMNRVLEHAASDMTVCVQAGITLEALQRALAWQDQWLPVDPPTGAGRSPGGRTIGGMIATNSLGPLRLGLAGGDWRRLILGVRWVDASGTIIKGGGQTVKNVAGYSSPRMLIGSAGTLGVIAEVTLRTFARPADERCVIFFCAAAAQAEELLAAILLSPTTPDYLELVGGRTWAANPLGLPTPAEDGGGQGMALVAGFLGRAETCAGQLEIVRGLTEAAGVESIAQTAAQAGRLRLWMTSEPAAGEAGVGLRLQAASSGMARLVEEIQAGAGAKGWVVSEAASGVLRAVISGAGTGSVVEELAKSHGEDLVVTQGKFVLRSPHPLAARLKGALDPRGVFGQFP